MSDKNKDTAAASTPDAGTLAKCGSCEFEQPAVHKCCVECGQTMLKAAQAEFDAAMGQLGEFHKTQLALPATPEVTPTDHSADADLINKARSTAGVEALETEMAERLISGQGITADYLAALMVETRAGRRDLGTLADVMSKAFHAGLNANRDETQAMFNDLKARVDLVLNAPAQSRVARLTPVHKAVVTPEGGPPQEDRSLAGDVLTKCAIDLVNGGKLDPVEATLTQQYANQGHSLASLEQVAPRLHARLVAGMAAAAAH